MKNYYEIKQLPSIGDFVMLLNLKIIRKSNWINYYKNHNSRDKTIIAYLLLHSYSSGSNELIKLDTKKMVKTLSKWQNWSISGRYYEARCNIRNVLRDLIDCDLLKYGNLSSENWINQKSYISNDKPKANDHIKSYLDASGHWRTISVK